MKPRSIYDKAGGMVFFPRMLDKIRLHAAGKLDADYEPNLGKDADRRCTSFLRVSYDDLRAETLKGERSDDELLQWCFEKGRALNEDDLTVWNGFAMKMGWNDFVTEHLIEAKAKAGLSDRDDIQTMPQLFDVEEGRKA